MRLYDLRKSFGENFYIVSGYDVKAIANALNHSNLKSVHHYLSHISMEQERDIPNMT